MARGEWSNNNNNNNSNNNYYYYNGGNSRGCSYKRTTLIVCSLNIVVALYVLHSLYTSLYLYPYPTTNSPSSSSSFSHTAEQFRLRQESNRIRKSFEPTQLITLVKQLETKLLIRKEREVELPRHLKHKLIHEILVTLRILGSSANATLQRAAVESWRKQKLKEAEKIIREETINSTILPGEADVIVSVLSADWAEFSEEFGLCIPVQVIHKEHDDKPEGEEEFEIVAGRKLPPECHGEPHTDYGGAAVRWGLTHHQESAYDCCMACLDQAKRAKPGEQKCNIWVYCPSETGCYSPDIYEHKNQECWLKYAETPTLNFKDIYPESYRSTHQNAPVIVPWMSGVVSV